MSHSTQSLPPSPKAPTLPPSAPAIGEAVFRPESRAALLMHAVDGMPYEEIAQVLDISLAAVKVKIYRARLALAGIRNP